MLQLHTEWSWPLAVYLFLGGLGAGAMVASAVAGIFTGDRFRSTLRFAAWSSVLALAAGTACLLVEVGKPFRALVLFNSFVNFGSWMAAGAWLLFSAILVNGLIALLYSSAVVRWLGRRWNGLDEQREIWRAILLVTAVPLNLGVAIYTGMLLGALEFRPFWHTALLPCLFTASALDTGIGLVAAYATLRERAPGAARLRLGLEIGVIVVIALEAAALVFFLRTNLQGPVDAAAAASLLLNGRLQVPFWALVVGLGLGVPLLACLAQLSGLTRRVPALAPLVGASSCMVGGFTLRTLVLLAGLPVMLTSPDMFQFMTGARFLP